MLYFSRAFGGSEEKTLLIDAQIPAEGSGTLTLQPTCHEPQLSQEIQRQVNWNAAKGLKLSYYN